MKRNHDNRDRYDRSTQLRDAMCIKCGSPNGFPCADCGYGMRQTNTKAIDAAILARAADIEEALS